MNFTACVWMKIFTDVASNFNYEESFRHLTTFHRISGPVQLNIKKRYRPYSSTYPNILPHLPTKRLKVSVLIPPEEFDEYLDETSEGDNLSKLLGEIEKVLIQIFQIFFRLKSFKVECSQNEAKNTVGSFYYADSSSVDRFDFEFSYLSSTKVYGAVNGNCMQRKFAYPTSLDNYLKFSTSPLPQMLLFSSHDLKPLGLMGRDPTDEEIDRAIAKRAQFNKVKTLHFANKPARKPAQFDKIFQKACLLLSFCFLISDYSLCLIMLLSFNALILALLQNIVCIIIINTRL